MDLDTIQAGDDFLAVIEQKLDMSDVLIAVIGNRWLTITEEDGTLRLDNSRDFVRLEIARALKRGIRVIPVLVGRARMPRANDLPDDLRSLCDRQAVELSDSNFHRDAQRLIAVIQRNFQDGRLEPTKANSKRSLAILLSALGVVVLAGVLFVRQQMPVHNESGNRRTISDATRPKEATRNEAGKASEVSKASVNITGRWNAKVKYDWGDSYNETFEFDVDGNELSGSAGFLGSRGGRGRAILDGKVEGNRISFLTKSLTISGSNGETTEEKHYYKGVIDGDRIQFSMVTDSSLQPHSPVQFTAERSEAGLPSRTN